MQAIVHRIYGPPSCLAVCELPPPSIGPHDVLVRVNATTVNRTDCALLKAKPFIMRFFTGLVRPRNPVSGSEFSGEIVATGHAVTAFKVGQSIFGFNHLGLGSHAAYLAVSERDAVACIPGRLSMAQAAACMEGAHYAYNYINKVKIARGDKILINGASGGIGSALLQFCVALGAQVSAVSEQQHHDLLLSLGAHSVIDYTKDNFTTGSEQFDFIFDAVGKSSFSQSKAVLKMGGAYLSSELGYLAQNLYLPLITKFCGKRRVIFPLPGPAQESMRFILQQIEAGNYTPVIDRIYPLHQIADAFAYVDQGGKRGNVVIGM